MTDYQGLTDTKTDDDPADSVAVLASRAVTLLAAQRVRNNPEMSRRMLEDLIDAALFQGIEGVERIIDTMLHAGVSEDRIIGSMIPDAARHLGDAWCSDGLGFAEVTIGSVRLQHALRLLAADPVKRASVKGSGPSVLILVPRNENHTLGAMVMTEQFRRAGISVRLLLGESDRTVLRAVATGRYEATFISVASVDKLHELRDMIDAMRVQAPRNSPIVVGGAIGHVGSDVIRITGADHAASDPFEALRFCGLETPVAPHRRQKLLA